MRDGIENTAQTIAPIIFLALGVTQLVAFMEGLDVWLGLSGIWAVLLFVALLFTGLLSALPISLVGFYGATEGWGWAWWQAAILCFPFLVFCVGYMAVAGAANVWRLAPHRRQDGLIAPSANEAASSGIALSHSRHAPPKFTNAGLWVAVVAALSLAGFGIKLYSDKNDALTLAQYEREKAVLEADEARRERDAMAIAVKPPQAKRVEINPEQPQTLWQTEVVPALPQREAAIGTNLFGTATTSSIDKLDALDDDGMITFERQDVEAQISGKTCDQVKREIAALTEHRRSNGMPISFLLFEELNAMQAFACDRKLATYPPRDN